MSPYDVWRFAELTPTPWRNGGGSTYEIAAHPAGSTLDDFDWRISIAAVDAAGPFSTFAGVDRILTLLEGSSMQLTIDGAHHALQSLSTVHFAGESRVDCEVPAGPTRDLNVMTRRGAVSASLELVEIDAPATLSGAAPIVVTVSGHVVAGSHTLGPLDGMIAADRVAVDGAGVVAVIRLTSLPVDGAPEAGD